jgi:hypothetical protein
MSVCLNEIIDVRVVYEGSRRPLAGVLRRFLGGSDTAALPALSAAHER